MTYFERLRILERTGSMHLTGVSTSLGSGTPGRSRGNRHRRRLQRIMAIYGAACVYCGVIGQRLTVDHYIPRAKGGDENIANTVPACESCNGLKGDRLPLAFVVGRLQHRPRI
jgi:5-methylcytosine-specific restriction endonuclease McrA